MNELFLSILMFACSDFAGQEKAICTRDMIACRETVLKEVPETLRQDQLIKRCLEGVYLEYYLETRSENP